MSDEGPPLLRPIPRRPFDLSLTTPTPPEQDSYPSTPNPELIASASRLLNPQPQGDQGSLSRSQSILNLTSSTLFGIFAPPTPTLNGHGHGHGGFDRFDRVNDRLGALDRLDRDETEPSTPWGTGAQTPVKRRDVDDGTFELMKDRSHVPMLRRRDSTHPTKEMGPSGAALVMALGLRIGLLFLLGMGYGALITRLRADRHMFGESMGRVETGWRYLVVWGVSGVALGALLPWFDGVWQSAFGDEMEFVRNGRDTEKEKAGSVRTGGHGTDWTLVVRSIGAFVGIVFAIRKLPWASTLQVSLTLALVNPFLWYLIDRSKPGFLLSAAVGLTGSAILLGVNPDMMPTPHASSSPHHNSSTSSSAEYVDPLAALGGIASQETIESGIWMLSVLFCSCVCFGNIGRRLALNREAGREGLVVRQ